MSTAVPDPAAGSLSRSVGFGGVSAFVLNGIIGAGVFAFPAAVAALAGGIAPWLILGVGMTLFPIVMVMARLATLFDGTGGPILYVESAFGRAAGFQIGWMQCLSSVSATAANVTVLADYVLRLAAPGASRITHLAVVAAALVALCVVNLMRVGGLSRVLQWVSVGKLAPLLLLAIVAVPLAGASGLAPAPPAELALLQAVLISAYAFIGFEGVLTVAGEARAPERDLPRALAIVFVAVTLLYALLTWAYVSLVPATGTPDRAPLFTLAAIVLGGAGATVMALTAIVSIFGNCAFSLLIVSRRLVAMARIDTIPTWFGAVSAGSAIPRNAILFAFVICAALALSGGFAALALLSVASRLVVYLGSFAALPVIERQRGLNATGLQRFWLVSGTLSALVLIAGSTLASWIGLGVTMLVGGALYFLHRQASGRQGQATG